MKKHIQILLSTFICIGCSLLCHASECKSPESITAVRCFFKKNPPIKVYQKVGLLFITTIYENTSSSKIETEFYQKEDKEWTYIGSMTLGPKDKIEFTGGKYPIFLTHNLIKVRVLGYPNALYFRSEGNKIMSIWFDKDE